MLPRRPRADTRGVEKSCLVVKRSSHQDVEKQYEDIRKLGSGAFGTVNLVRDRSTAQERVRKIVSTATMEPGHLEIVRKEIELLSTLDHPGVVKLYEFCEDPVAKQLVLILEHMPGGTCDTFLDFGQGLPSEALLAKLIYQVLSALSYCHEQGIIHRDVKPENLALTRAAGAWSSPDCKLIDFGIACQSKPGQLMSTRPIGSRAYMAPEMVRCKPYTAKVDTWALGVTTFELLAGCLPFGGRKQWKQESSFDYILEYGTFEDAEAKLGGSFWWGWRSSDAHEFVSSLLCVDPSQRPTAAEALEHPWLQSYQPDQPRFTQDIAQSLASYASLPSIARCCLLIIAARMNIPNLEILGGIFLGADADGDGKLSLEDLAGALEDVQEGWWSWGATVDIDVEKVLSAADLDHSGAIGFTEFVAACICGRHRSFEDLVRQAFHVLDTDRDGLVSIHQVQRLFRERDAPLLAKLPQHRPFNKAEWCACMGTVLQ